LNNLGEHKLKLYKGLVEASVSALGEIFYKNRQADKVIERVLKSNKKWGSRDRAFIASNTYEIVRWWRLVLYCAEIESSAEEHLWTIFGTWQVLKPAHLGFDSDGNLPDWVEFESIDAASVLNKYQVALGIRKIAQSIPDWLDETGEKELGDSWDQELKALNEEAPLILRVNTLRTNVETVRQIFGIDETELVKGVPSAILLKKRQNVSLRDSFKMGYFEVQDAGSQLIAPFLDIWPGQDVIDACAGAGGKSLHIATLMTNEGNILALDIESRKLEELEVRARRNGAVNLKTEWIGSEKVIQELTESADRLLLDVPCSGLGVLRRNPDTKWKLKPAFLDSIRKVQWEILSKYSCMVKVGGRMVYATCSILPSESEDQVKRFVKEFGDEWNLIKEHRTSPSADGFDGFYMALLEKY
jgi:16S rRNA (cytosine967-C5)-methyltransferase